MGTCRDKSTLLYGNRPYIYGQASYATSYTYDPLGRVVTETAPNGLVTNYNYNGLTTTVTVNNSTGVQTTSKTVNSQGWTLSTIDAASKVTSFTYDPNGNLLTTTDPKGNKIVLTYDIKGRKIAMNDPDMGAWTYTYDALGQLKSQRDAKLQTTSMVYDRLGRMIQRIEPSMTGNWFYDKYANNTVCNKGTGKLCEVTATGVATNGHRRVHTFDNLGRPIRVDNYVDGTTIPYQIDTSYDSFGRVATLTYPAVTIGTNSTRLTVKNNYNAAGYLSNVTDPAGTLFYWQILDMDADGNITREFGAAAATARQYDPLTGRLTSIRTNNGTAQDMTFAYDTLGNLTARTDTFTLPSAASINETFTYDTPNRLKTVTMTGTTSLTKSYNYDEIGNLIFKSDLGGTGVLTYPASGAGSVRPHAVSSVNGVINGVTNPNYTYDANGNMVTAFGGTRTITYASFNLPTRILRNGFFSDWVYDADHNRIKESTNNAQPGQADTIYFVNPGNQPLFEKHVNIKGTGLTEYRHFIAGGGVYTQYSNASQPTLKTVLKDHLGSTTAIVSSAGVLERYSYDAFGKTRNINGSDTASTVFRVPSTRRGFTGHEMMPEIGGGLIHMNGRIYDPNLGRFMTADPNIQFAGYSQSYNRYSYLLNSPLNGTDPTGYGMSDRQTAAIVVAIVATVATYGATSGYFAAGAEAAAGGGGLAGSTAFATFTATEVGAYSSLTFAGAALSGAAAGAVGAFAGSLVATGGDFEASARSAAYGAIGGAVGGGGFWAVGEYASFASNPIGNILGHAVVGCAQSSAQGGACGSGALSAGVGAIASGIGHGRLGKYANGVLTTVAGGVSSRLGGGSFEEGAAIALFGYLYNHVPHEGNDDIETAPTLPKPEDMPALTTLGNLATAAALEVDASCTWVCKLPWIRGVKIHAVFAAKVTLLGGDYAAEVSYKDHLVVPRGTSGSVRADAVYGKISIPKFAAELKTGGAYVSNYQAGQYLKHLPTGSSLYMIKIQ